ncbi:MAG: hypothetical protein KY475_25655 [Planctomycetes bacterium]|nr:hypothetical protein [Planctomycetota bacterium]
MAVSHEEGVSRFLGRNLAAFDAAAQAGAGSGICGKNWRWICTNSTF